MPIIQPNFEEIQKSGPIAEGMYRAKITKAEPGVSAAGNPKVTVEFAITVDDTTRTRNAHLVTSGKAAFQFAGLLRACHFDAIADAYADKSVAEKPGFDTDDLINQEVMVQIVPDMYQGELKDKIQGFAKV